MSIQDQLTELTKNQKTVLWWKKRGLKYEDIAKELNYGIEWVWHEMSGVYAILGVHKKASKRERLKFLRENVYPLIPDDLEEWLTKAPEPVGALVLYTSQITALVIADEGVDDDGDGNGDEGEKPPPQPPKHLPAPKRNGRAIAFIAFVCVLIAVIGISGYWLGSRNASPPAPIVITATPGINPEASQTINTSVVPPPPKASDATNTSISTFTHTSPPPTDTPIPTSTENPNVFLDDFADGLDPAWTVVFGKPVFVNGKLGASELTLFSLGDPSWTNYEIQFDAELLSDDYPCMPGPDDSAVSVRASDIDNRIHFGFTSCAFIWYFVTDGNGDVIPGIKSTDTANDVRFVISVVGNQIELHTGSTLLSSFLADDFPSGFIYLRLKRDNWIDNFKVTLLE